MACCQCVQASAQHRSGTLSLKSAKGQECHSDSNCDSEVETLVTCLGRNVLEKLKDLVPPLLDLALTRSRQEAESGAERSRESGASKRVPEDATALDLASVVA